MDTIAHDLVITESNFMLSGLSMDYFRIMKDMIKG